MAGGLMRSISTVLLIAKIFGLFPFKLRKLYLRSVLVVYIVMGSISAFCIRLYEDAILSNNFTIFTYINAQLHVQILLDAYAIIKFSKKWTSVMRIINRIDKRMDNFYGYPKDLQKRMVAILGLLWGYGTLYVIFYEYTSLRTFDSKNGEVDFDRYLHSVYAYFFKYINYSRIWGFFFVVHRSMGSAFIVYADSVIVCVCIALKRRFSQINRYIRSNGVQFCQSVIFWKLVRKDYNDLLILTKEFEKGLSLLTLSSITFNSGLLLIFLHLSISVKGYSLNSFFAVVGLLSRLLSVIIAASSLNDESKKPSTIINFSHLPIFNVEIKRLLTQISFDTVVFTGCKFFAIRLEIILKIAALLVTYELALIQYYEIK